MSKKLQERFDNWVTSFDYKTDDWYQSLKKYIDVIQELKQKINTYSSYDDLNTAFKSLSETNDDFLERYLFIANNGISTIRQQLILRDVRLRISNSVRADFSDLKAILEEKDPHKCFGLIHSFIQENKYSVIYRFLRTLFPQDFTAIDAGRKFDRLKKEYEKENFFDSLPNNQYDCNKILMSGINHQDVYLKQIFFWFDYEHYFYNNMSLNEHQANDNDDINDIANLLLYKNQIILQGPPGTGKTKLAKEIASFLTSKNQSEFISSSIDSTFILNNLKIGLIIKGNSNNSYEIQELEGNIIRVKNNNGKQYSYNVDSVLKRINDNLLDINDGGKVVLNAVGKYILNKFKVQENIENDVKLIQFHPSYTYEDFVRGITAKPNDSREGVIFNAENKILGELAKKALNNFLLSQEDNSIAVKDKWIEESFNDFKIEIESLIGENDLVLSGNINIYKVENDCFRYGKDWQFPSRINFSEFKSLIKAVLNSKLDLDGNVIPKEISVHAHYRFTYYLALLRLFFKKYEFTVKGEKEPLKNFVLIIDEINRANLSSVLGELIYALEYRGEAVESMYAVDEDNKLILPPNLYIIGTMNTADRSVGHIDYAIRRRFAFVDVLPENLKEKYDLENFHEVLFLAVEKLFKEHTSPEFEVKDVKLGHSYFIDKSNEDNGVGMDIRFEYEIKPILLEYVKDGVLIGKGKDIKKEIEELSVLI